MKFGILFIFLVCLIPVVDGLSLIGSPMPADVYYESGTQREFTYKFGTNSHTQDYRIELYSKAEYDIKKFVTVEPNYFKQVPPNSGAEFKVKLDFFEDKITPGRHDVLVIVKETQAAPGAQIGALAQAAVRFRITALYPSEYLNWGISVPDANIGEDILLTGTVTNWGVPTVNDAIITYKIYDKEKNLVREAKSEVISVDSKKSYSSEIAIPSDDLPPDDYTVRARLNYADKESITERKFRLGSKNIKVLDMTKEFVSEAINIAEVSVESGWNDDIEGIKGKVLIYDNEEVIQTFNLEEISLKKWRSDSMRGYFETFGIEEGKYKSKVVLSYDDETSEKEFEIEISEEGTAEVTDQVPGGISNLFTTNNLILVALIIILGMNVWYLVGRRKH